MKLLKFSPIILMAIYCAGCHKSDVTPPVKTQPKATPTIVILGSSSAAGEGATPVDSAWAYRLQSVSGTKANFINLAVPGYVTYQAMPTGYSVANRPAPDTAKNITKALSYKPALVMICFPTNDIADGYTDVETMNNYAIMVHMLDSAKVQYIIFGTQPRNFPDSTERARLKTQNDKIVSVYGSMSNDFLDQLSTSSYMINPLYSAGDGIHLNNAGHAIILNATLHQPVFVAVTGVTVK